ncbi:multidrug effflux MFS transporter [Pseudooceanicola sp. HF7]|uniref:multidrug effflux MFS transporter n=1 Tax=Pseudooceanicola sp. HF7 TaxID=2721560 RepID=UPI00143162F5|nr:multidrug effflux MFS transporter [Pseudooceanicola sp. HF7]NIZ09883.1 multidrug effflux MFS transporter [Pseudooceanicola sp. HF7]
MTRKLHPVEFVALMAMMMATVAFSIDSMLPALGDMAEELSPDNFNNIQLVLSSFMIGMGAGTLFTGPLSDRLGRKSVMLGGAAIYIAGALLAWRAETLEMLIMGRALQGLGAAGPRVVAIAIIRDLYAGREMARLVSFVMMVFTIFPALAPLLGSFIISHGGWRGLFLAFFAFSAISSLWLIFRLPESLPRERRQPFRLSGFRHAIREMYAIPIVRSSILVQIMVFSMMFITISLIEPAFEQVFDRGEQFPYWFFGLGLMAASSSMVNAIFVGKYGMRKIITLAVGVFLVFSLAMLAVILSGYRGPAYFYIYLAWQATVYYQIGLTAGNLNALAMEPLGHIAGFAASVIGAVSTVSAAVLSTLIAQTFNGSLLPQVLSSTVLAALAFVLMLHMRKLDRVRDQ